MLSRRDARLRKDYLFQKSREADEQARYAKKRKLQEALETDSKLPHELQKEAHTLRKDFLYDDAQDKPATSADNEYINAGELPPRILVTTSRDPSSRLQQFAKEMKLMLPNSQRINRGGYVIKEIVDACRSNDVTDLVILHEHRGNPDGMIISHFPHGPTAYFSLHNVVLRHDIDNKGTMSEAYPHLIFDGFTKGGKLGARVIQILKHLFPVPREDSKRVLTFANRGDFVSFRHHVFYAPSARAQLDHGAEKRIEIAEVGPRMELRPYKITQGTVEMREADVEWSLKPYQRTARKRDLL